MEIHELPDLLRRRDASGGPYLEFQRSVDLTSGLYVLPPGGVDDQQPHAEDEIYCVLAGRARITVGGEVAPVGPGTVVFVAAGVAHQFHDIADELQVLVVFGPAEGSRAVGNDGRAGGRRPGGGTPG